MEKADTIRWPEGAGDLLAVRIALPSPCTLNQTALLLGDETVAVFLPEGREPIVLREETKDLSFEIDGFAAGLAQLFYSKEYRGAAWLVRTCDREVAWRVNVDGAVASGSLWFQVLDAQGLVASCGEGEVAWDGLTDWVRQAWQEAFAALARDARARAPDAPWEAAAMEAEATVAPALASRGLRINLRDEVEVDRGEAAPGAGEEPPMDGPTAEECLLDAMALIGELQESGAIVFADGMVSEQASVALADHLLAEGCRVDVAGAERIWAHLQELPGVLLMIAWEDFAAHVERVDQVSG